MIKPPIKEQKQMRMSVSAASRVKFVYLVGVKNQNGDAFIKGFVPFQNKFSQTISMLLTNMSVEVTSTRLVFISSLIISTG